MKQKQELAVEFMRLSSNSVCIICGKSKEGFEVEEDMVIKGIRKIKKFFGIEKKKRPVVCKECYPKYLNLRKKFERKQKVFGILLIIFFTITFFTSPDKISAIIGSFILFIVFLFILFFYYVPKVKKEKEESKK